MRTQLFDNGSLNYLKKYAIILRLIFLGSFLSTTPFIGTAQTPSYRQFTADNGLPSNEVYKVIEDRNGYIWMATDRGVVRYDGYDCEIFTTKDGLSNNVVFWIHEDDKGRIWFSCLDNTICFYDQGSIHIHPASEQLKQESIKIIYSIYVEPNETVWLGVGGMNTIIRLDPNGTIKKFKSDNVKNGDIVIFKINESNLVFGKLMNGAKQGRFNTVLQHDRDGDLQKKFRINPTNRSVISILKQEDATYLTNANNLYQLSDTSSSDFVERQGKVYTASIFKDHEGLMWAGNSIGGVSCFSLDNMERPIHHLFRDLTVTSICQDREDGFWFSTAEAGTFYCPSLKVETIELLDKKIIDICHIDSTIWISTSDGAVNEVSKKAEKYVQKEIFSVPDVYLKLYADSYKNVWISFSDIMVEKKDTFVTTHSPFNFTFSKLIWPNDSTIWLKVHRSLICVTWPHMEKIDTIQYPEKLKNINVIKPLSQDMLVIGSHNGLWILSEGEIKRHPNHQPILENRINDLEVLSNGDLILATMGAGIIRLNSLEKIIQVTENDGLLSDLYNCTYTLPGDTITWVGSNKGLSRIKWTQNGGSHDEIFNLTVFNGLRSNDVLKIDFVQDKLWVGTSRGITLVDVNNLTGLRKKPLIHTTAIYVNSELQPKTDEIFVSSKAFVKIHFNGISMSSKGNMSYQYRVKGLADNWAKLDNRFLEFKLFTPGTYELEVYAVNASGVISSNSVKKTIIVSPLFWQTWWFRTCIILALITLIGFIINRRFKIKQRENFLLTKSLQAEQEALSSQITPHFLFNSLNSIQFKT
ncbi:MAG: ligand-binding sensor domain-containing protein [Crocinitomix sp.]|jgi:ligand-binding sensor domain-containing protein